ncbi:alpha/beta hydrolase [Achromobacter sp. JD417]|uniref:alpha/beta fold hydrolase n=1 Tax=Achromobacter sp. JD417 TaxID=2893881 RepID=UPI0035A62164
MTTLPGSVIRPTMLFVHGWAFDSAFWDPLRAALPEWPQAVCDAGYFGPVQEPHLTGPVIAVGHSLGVLRLLSRLPDQCVGLVSINGFARFSSAADYPAGVPVRMLDRMRKRLAESADDVLRDFRQRCGDDSRFDEPRTAALHQGLEALRDDDQRAALATLPVPLLALAGSADAIVPAGMMRAAFAGRPDGDLHWRERGGHLLPVSDTDWCAAHIRAFAARVAPPA